jgi:hypothetical protein
MKIFLHQLILMISTSVFLIGSCKKAPPAGLQEQILVRIDDKASISVNEFIRRAEYTPRPDYCKYNSYIHKKIILNSLIAEKLLALEAGENSPLLQNDEFLRFIQGRKEQAMRQWMHHVEATEKVTLDEGEVKNAYTHAGKEYEVAYFSVSDSTVARNIKNILISDSTLFDSLYYTLSGDNKVPQRKVTYDADENFKVHTALYSKVLHKGQILNPIKIADDDYLFVKIVGWSDNLAMTEKQRQERSKTVREKLTAIKAGNIWQQRVAGIMRGKKLDFNEDIFYKLRDLFFEIYFRTEKEKKEALTERIWRNNEKEINNTITETMAEELLAESFFSIDNEIWTVDKFRKTLISHPLVFRKFNMNSNEFSKQFKFAIADLMRDYYVTQEAYKMGYDKVNVVERDVNMWRDTFLAYQQKHQYLNSIGETRSFVANYHNILKDKLNPYIDSLQTKYYKQIELDFDLFEEIALTTIDLFVKQPQQPFQYVVPLFPVITTDNLIEYVRKMDK